MADLEIGALEAQKRLSELLKQVEKGQKIYITRRGRRVALLTHPGTAHSPTQNAGSLLERIRTFRGKAKPGRLSLKSLVETGRR